MITDVNRRRLCATAALLPPTHNAGLEYGLGTAGGGLDLQQGLNLNQKTVAQLLSEGAIWPAKRFEQLGKLLHEWQSNNALQATFLQIWLEFDCSQREATTPSLFLTLAPKLDLHAAREALLAVSHLSGLPSPTREQLHSLGKDMESNILKNRISHIGLMLSRKDQSVRVIREVEDLPALYTLRRASPQEAAAAYLAQELSDIAEDFAEIRFCESADGGEPADLSVECFFPSGSAEARERILRWLLENALCHEHEAKALKAWPGVMTVLEAHESWPESLLLQSLSRVPRALSALEFRLGHLKLTMNNTGVLTAKAYFGYFERWLARSPASA